MSLCAVSCGGLRLTVCVVCCGRLHPEDTFKSLVDGKKLVFTTDARPFKRCLAFQVCRVIRCAAKPGAGQIQPCAGSNHVQAHKAIQRARSIGLIDDHWLLGKNFKTASPVATNVQVQGARIGVTLLVKQDARPLRCKIAFLSIAFLSRGFLLCSHEAVVLSPLAGVPGLDTLGRRGAARGRPARG